MKFLVLREMTTTLGIGLGVTPALGQRPSTYSPPQKRKLVRRLRLTGNRNRNRSKQIQTR